MAYIETKNLTFSYPKSNSKALKDVSISIDKGEFVLLMGKTGSGKSTLLKLLKKEIAPFGEIQGEIIGNTNSAAFVVQDIDSSFVCDKVRGELAFALENKKLPNDVIAVKLGEIVSFFNLNDILDADISELSGGQKATVAVAAAMISAPDVLILDEPLSQLDPKASYQLVSLLQRVNSELGTTVIMSSHISDNLVDICDKMYIMDNGKIAADGTAHSLSKCDNLLPFFPVYTSLFDSRPLSVKEAIFCNINFKEKEITESKFTQKAVEVKNITFSYGKNQKDILDGLNLTVYKGSVHSIIGANAGGKTTLLKVIAGIKKQYAGKVKVYGKIAYLPQNPRYLFTKDTVLEEAGESFAKRLCPNDYDTRHPYDLSGGEMQKLALEILFNNDFDIILMDEPSKSLDYFSKQELKKTIKELAKNGKTVVLVSHDLDFVGEISDFVSFLSDGIITITGSRRQVLSSLDFYTTQIRRITKGKLKSAVSAEDLI